MKRTFSDNIKQWTCLIWFCSQVWNKEVVWCSPAHEGSEEAGHEQMPAEPERLLRAHPHHPQVGARHSAGGESPRWKLSSILVSGQPDHTFRAEDLFWPTEVPVVKFISAFMKEKML